MRRVLLVFLFKLKIQLFTRLIFFLITSQYFIKMLQFKLYNLQTTNLVGISSFLQWIIKVFSLRTAFSVLHKFKSLFKFSCLFSCRNHISVIQCFRLFTALLCLLDTQIYTPRQLSANPHTSAIHKLISHTPKLTLAVYSSLPPITSFSHMSEWPYVITFHTSLCSSQVA